MTCPIIKYGRYRRGICKDEEEDSGGNNENKAELTNEFRYLHRSSVFLVLKEGATQNDAKHKGSSVRWEHNPIQGLEKRDVDAHSFVCASV